MKRVVCSLVMVFLLCGCGKAQTFETVEDEWAQSVMAPMATLQYALPDEAAGEVFQSENGDRLYLCDGYTISVQTRRSGDTDKTIRELCGYEREKLCVLATRSGECKRYDWVWTAAGENGDQVGRAAVLDDGNYHYCLSVMADAKHSGSFRSQWQVLFDSLSL